MSITRVSEGLVGTVKHGFELAKADVLKNSGPIRGLIDSILSNPQKHEVSMKKDFDDYSNREFTKIENTRKQFQKSKKGQDVNALITQIKGLNDTDDLIKFYKWRFYFDTKISRGMDKAKSEASKQQIIADLVSGIDQSKTPIDNLHWDELNNFVNEKIEKEVNNKRKEYEQALTKAQKKIPESKKGDYMSFKTFLESKEKNLKEASPAQSAQEQATRLEVAATKQQANAATAKAKADMLASKEQEDAANKQADAIKQNASTPTLSPLGEDVSVYAGGNGVSKKIPFTKDPLLKNQAVGKKDGDKETDNDNDAKDEAEDLSAKRKKDLEEITKKLQALADEACAVAMNNIDATEDNAIDKMAAKEFDSIKEGQNNWATLEKALIDEDCVGGICTLGGQQSGPIGGGSFNISPMSTIGSLNTNTPQGNPNQVADRSTIYSFIKNNDLHQTNRDYALNTLLSQFGNSSTELSTILSDAILSGGNPEGIDQSYGYSDSLLPVDRAFPPEGGSDFPPDDAPPSDLPQVDHTQGDGLEKAWGEMSELNDL